MILEKILRQAKRQLVLLSVSHPSLTRCMCIGGGSFSTLSHHIISELHKRGDKFDPFRGSCLKLDALRNQSSVPQPPASSSTSRSTDAAKSREERVCENNTTRDNAGGASQTRRERHTPVMVEEVLSCLQINGDQIVLDMTFGAGGHAKRILKESSEVRYLAADRDPLAFRIAEDLASEYKNGQIIPICSKFSDLPVHLKREGIKPGTVDCVLMDLGASSMQFDSAHRGFALSRDGPLDMRMDGPSDPDDTPSAADVVNSLEPHDLARILKKYGEEKKAKTIAHAIVEARYAFGPFTRTKQLADVVKSVFESTFRHDKLHRHSHVATKTFQALRIFVNDELNEVHNGLKVAHHFLKPNGRCAVISFHSLEDRIVKRHFHGIDLDAVANMTIRGHFRNSNVSYDAEDIQERFLSKRWSPLKRKISEPTPEEVENNPRSRSAKLRAAVKLEGG